MMHNAVWSGQWLSVSNILHLSLMMIDFDTQTIAMDDEGWHGVQMNIETQQPALPHPQQGVWSDIRLMRRDEISVYGNNKDTIFQQGVYRWHQKSSSATSIRLLNPRLIETHWFFHPSNTLPRLMSCACGSNKCYLINSIVQGDWPEITWHFLC